MLLSSALLSTIALSGLAVAGPVKEFKTPRLRPDARPKDPQHGIFSCKAKWVKSLVKAVHESVPYSEGEAICSTLLDKWPVTVTETTSCYETIYTQTGHMRRTHLYSPPPTSTQYELTTEYTTVTIPHTITAVQPIDLLRIETAISASIVNVTEALLSTIVSSVTSTRPVLSTITTVQESIVTKTVQQTLDETSTQVGTVDEIQTEHEIYRSTIVTHHDKISTQTIVQSTTLPLQVKSTLTTTLPAATYTVVAIKYENDTTHSMKILKSTILAFDPQTTTKTVHLSTTVPYQPALSTVDEASKPSFATIQPRWLPPMVDNCRAQKFAEGLGIRQSLLPTFCSCVATGNPCTSTVRVILHEKVATRTLGLKGYGKKHLLCAEVTHGSMPVASIAVPVTVTHTVYGSETVIETKLSSIRSTVTHVQPTSVAHKSVLVTRSTSHIVVPSSSTIIKSLVNTVVVTHSQPTTSHHIKSLSKTLTRISKVIIKETTVETNNHSLVRTTTQHTTVTPQSFAVTTTTVTPPAHTISKIIYTVKTTAVIVSTSKVMSTRTLY